MSLKGPQQSTSLFSTTVKQLLAWLLMYKVLHNITVLHTTYIVWSEVDISPQNTSQSHSAHLPKRRAGIEREFKTMTLRSELHTWSHAIILLLHKQKACKPDGWVCDGSTSSFHGCYCKGVTCDLNAVIPSEMCVSVNDQCNSEYCCSLSWWSFQNKTRRMSFCNYYQ